MSDQDDARKAWADRVAGAVDAAHKDFQSEYADAINALQALSLADIDAMIPGGVGQATYDQLIEVVQEASQANMAQAELKRRIEALGAHAISIARRVPSLAAFL